MQLELLQRNTMVHHIEQKRILEMTTTNWTKSSRATQNKKASARVTLFRIEQTGIDFGLTQASVPDPAAASGRITLSSLSDYLCPGVSMLSGGLSGR